MPKLLSDIELDAMVELTKTLLLINETIPLVKKAELSYKEFFNEVSDIYKAYTNNTLDDYAEFLKNQLQEVGISTKELVKVFNLG